MKKLTSAQEDFLLEQARDDDHGEDDWRFEIMKDDILLNKIERRFKNDRTSNTETD